MLQSSYSIDNKRFNKPNVDMKSVDKHSVDNSVEYCDVLIIGSGGAALLAALKAAAAGLSVLIVEKSPWLGGTTAMSGGATWVPANHHAKAAGIEDSPAEALEYLRATAPEGWAATEDALWRAFADSAAEMLAFIEAHSPLRFALTNEADPLATFAGAKPRGRMLAPLPLAAGVLSQYGHFKLRPSPLPQFYTYHEVIKHDIWHHPIGVACRLSPQLVWRFGRRLRTKGGAMITGLLAGCLALGCRVVSGARVESLITQGSHQVIGARYCFQQENQQGIQREVRAAHGVVIASGGFEGDVNRRAKHFPGAVDYVCSPDSNTGDGQRMAEEIGAQLAHMDQANMGGAVPWRYLGKPYGLSVYFHYEPNAILVDARGQRFTNEFIFNLGAVLDARDEQGMPMHLPAWLVSDSRLLQRSPMLRLIALRYSSWMIKAPSLEALAKKIALPEGSLDSTVRRFNDFCRQGIDEDFHREQSAAHGEADTRFHGGLMEISQPPFIAVPFNRSFLATKGGPRTDEFGRVRHGDGEIIRGLFCAGVAMANPIGTKAVGAGTTLGPNLTWGYICGRTLANQAASSNGVENAL